MNKCTAIDTFLNLLQKYSLEHFCEISVSLLQLILPFGGVLRLLRFFFVKKSLHSVDRHISSITKSSQKVLNMILISIRANECD